LPLTLPCRLTAFPVQPGDTIDFTHSRFGWAAKEFMVTHTALVQDGDKDSPTLGIDLSLIPVESSIYDWDETTDEGSLATPAALTLPGASDIAAPTSLTLTSDSSTSITRADGIVHSQILVEWVSPAEQIVLSGGHIEVWIKTHAGTDWRLDGQASGADTFYYISRNITDGVDYDVMLIAVASTGERSPSVTDSVTCDGSVSFDYSSGTAVVNSNFEASDSILPPPGWAARGSSTLSYETSTQQSGVRSLKVSVTASDVGVVSARKYKVIPGEIYKTECYVKSSSGASSYIQFLFFDADDVNIGYINASSGSTSWTKITGVGTAPAGAVYARIFLVSGTVSTYDCYFDNINLVRQTDPTDEMLTKGSIPPKYANGFTYTSTTTSITISWPANQAVYRADGTVTTIGSGSQVITGLVSGATYNFYPF
ncbi:MAG: carbohydrate binding domain-containing protein, partial [Terriglobales bacterium]